MPGPIAWTQEWADATREYSNNDELTRKQTKGLNIKLWYIYECPGYIYGQPGKTLDGFLWLKWNDGFMEEFVIAEQRPAPCEEWRNLKFDKKGFWGGFTCHLWAGCDNIYPVGDPVVAKEQLLEILCDPRVRLDQSATAAYKLLKPLQGWLDGLARANKALDVEWPHDYVSGGGEPMV